MADEFKRRPRDIISITEAIAAKSGHIEPVDEEFYQEFLGLTTDEIRRLVILILTSHAKEVFRLSERKTDAAACGRVADFAFKVLGVISTGLLRCDAFGRLHFVSRLGSDCDELGLSPALEKFVAENRPVVLSTVEETLHWVLRSAERQGQLPL